jgi:hypothetical protein
MMASPADSFCSTGAGGGRALSGRIVNMVGKE